MIGNPVLKAQNLETIGQKDQFKLTGGISTSQVYYSSFGADQRRDPYTYFLTGNVNLSMYGWNAPFSYTYSNQNSSFQQPFNQYSLHPYYKWIRAHLGYTSMTFSPYTLSGHLFYGAGLELTPGDKFKIEMMYGRLNKSVGFDSTSTNNTPSYKRMGYGLKLGYKLKSGVIEAIFFRSKDDKGSLDSIPLDLGLTPQENLVLSLKTTQTIVKGLNIGFEYSASALTSDSRLGQSSNQPNNIFKYTGPFFNANNSSAYFNAFNATLQYSFNVSSLALRYERIDPEYQTHGAYYFTNDLENIAINASTSLLKQKVNVSANVGIQRDDLENQKISNMQRVVTSFNVGINATEKLNISLSYSNFQSYTNIKSKYEQLTALTPYDNLDTLNFTQISQNANMNIGYNIKSNETSRQQVNMNVSYQKADDKQGDEYTNAGSDFINLNAGYNYSMVPVNLSLSLALNYNRSNTQAVTTEMYGPTLSVNKSFFDKLLRSGISASFNNAYSNSDLTSSVFNIRLNNSYTYKKQHSINLSLVYVNRNNPLAETGGKFSEFTATLGYSFNFR
ncbi:MAG: hypothetical protein A2X13_15470 [Bacteroidetes bacterium GWC2_33_15]|nr:MAG: hypothetical protein A2X10_04755 [Bacteroidetes bacterium GWA2_33_15]OFX49903.1 MAG: hypothetical protein A2X13_15470 [Bacteroidetes bacterium GWC2_33_15]OFX66211.1 MAG: hypothetical protein A2X15_07015 [Bacteroidetes bacterium GWB2_32_14]OFX70084.1 MAG: hypothetical protein A2X14_05690 [Bacteroidetes bacterium GWD2_33_33]